MVRSIRNLDIWLEPWDMVSGNKKTYGFTPNFEVRTTRNTEIKDSESWAKPEFQWRLPLPSAWKEKHFLDHRKRTIPINKNRVILSFSPVQMVLGRHWLIIWSLVVADQHRWWLSTLDQFIEVDHRIVWDRSIQIMNNLLCLVGTRI